MKVEGQVSGNSLPNSSGMTHQTLHNIFGLKCKVAHEKKPHFPIACFEKLLLQLQQRHQDLL
jgi:hypothetical protein